MWEKQTGPAWNMVQATAFTPSSGPRFSTIFHSLLKYIFFSTAIRLYVLEHELAHVECAGYRYMKSYGVEVACRLSPHFAFLVIRRPFKS
jgi:hypothetical protein